MADGTYDGFGGGVRTGARWHGLVTLAGGVTSVALVVALAVWGYRLAVRDVAGIPVVRALEGPMRVAPDNPGGEIADHLGLAVNDIAGSGTAAPLPDRLVLAPRPVDLTAEDSAGLQALPPVAPATGAANAALAAAPVIAASSEMAAEIAPDMAPADGGTALAASDLPPAEAGLDPGADAVALALAEALAEGEVPLDAPVSDTGTLSAEPAPAGAIVRSLRPMPRPARGETAGAPVMASAEVPVSRLQSGERLVQLGAFDTEAQAREEWARLQGRFGELMAGKALVVQSAESGGRTFYRLRAHGFAAEEDSRRFCSALLAENTSCIPVVFR